MKAVWHALTNPKEAADHFVERATHDLKAIAAHFKPHMPHTALDAPAVNATVTPAFTTPTSTAPVSPRLDLMRDNSMDLATDNKRPQPQHAHHHRPQEQRAVVRNIKTGATV